VPVPRPPDWSISVSLKMLTGESTERPGKVVKGSPCTPAANRTVVEATPTANGRRHPSVRAAADATSSSGTT
jgi:hypothetical protein